MEAWRSRDKAEREANLGCPGGSAVEHLPLAQSVILGSRDRVPRRAPSMEPASPSASLSVSLMTK